MEPRSGLRILAVCSERYGSNDGSYVRAFRRAGHSVLAISSDTFFPNWKSLPLRLSRRLLSPKITRAFNSAIIDAARDFLPDLFFVFKGESVLSETVKFIRRHNVIAINFWPDVSFHTHGPLPPRALPAYDWIFNSKSYGLEDLKEQLKVSSASFLPHAFDPEVHSPIEVHKEDDANFICDASFIGNWSPKKEAMLQRVVQAVPDRSLRIWGANYWLKANGLRSQFQGHPVVGREYARAICASRVNICILSEKRTGSSSGDLTTARTFEIPPTGGFMLHERTEEAMAHFEESKECVFFDDPVDLVEKIRYFLAHDDERRAIAEAGRQRALTSGYSYDDRVTTVIAKYHELRAVCGPRQP